ncbi:MAG: hypothetical protein GDA53_00665 [Rhodobacteraceae bacterium]|nr:hypothetical protein [Paracoccaceae bacterium]
MTDMICPGLPGHWINGWLAALGITVLAPALRLHWTDDPEPVAVLSAQDAAPADVLTDAWPDREFIVGLPVAKNMAGQDAGTLARNVPVEDFRKRARAVRRCAEAWTLTSTITDLYVNKKNEVGHARFDPPVPKGLTLSDRLISTYNSIGDIRNRSQQIRASLAGCGKRGKGNGLGFDLARIGSQADDADRLTDPVIEVLAFFGLAFLPVRGPGIDMRQGHTSADTNVRQRGWRKATTKPETSFHWPAWGVPLDRWAIDALLDAWRPDKPKTWPLYAVHAGWKTVEYKSRSTNDTTRAYGSERIS